MTYRSRGRNNASTGQRNHRVSIYSVQETPDGAGGFILQEQLELTAWARVRRVWGQESTVAGALAGRQTVEIFIPASDAARGISTAWRLKDAHSGKVFNIRDVSLSEDSAEVLLLCESGVPT